MASYGINLNSFVKRLWGIEDAMKGRWADAPHQMYLDTARLWGAYRARDLTPEDLQLLDSIEKLAHGFKNRAEIRGSAPEPVDEVPVTGEAPTQPTQPYWLRSGRHG